MVESTSTQREPSEFEHVTRVTQVFRNRTNGNTELNAMYIKLRDAIVILGESVFLAKKGVSGVKRGVFIVRPKKKDNVLRHVVWSACTVLIF